MNDDFEKFEPKEKQTEQMANIAKFTFLHLLFHVLLLSNL